MYNGDMWGVQIMEVEDYSNASVVTYTSSQMATAMNGTENYVDFMFAPYSSGLTKKMLPISNANMKLGGSLLLADSFAS